MLRIMGTTKPDPSKHDVLIAAFIITLGIASLVYAGVETAKPTLLDYYFSHDPVKTINETLPGYHLPIVLGQVYVFEGRVVEYKPRELQFKEGGGYYFIDRKVLLSLRGS